jgi:PIN domain nuclease of toxin-antitoxin system
LIVVDTHAWLWWNAEDANLSAAARTALDEAAEVAVPAIVCWEVALLASLDRIRLALPVREWLDRALGRPNVRLLPLSLDIAVLSNSFGDVLHRDPADRMIAASALHLNSALVTRDERLRGFAALRCIW